MRKLVYRLVSVAFVIGLYVLVFHGAAPWPVVVLGALALVYYLVMAPAGCNAQTRRDQFCRNNSSGSLLGCHIRQHKWQRLRMVVSPAEWGDLSRAMTRGSSGFINSVAAVATLVVVAFESLRGAFAA